MRDWIEERLYVFAHSRRTQYALLVGFLGGLAILLLGIYLAVRLEFRGPISAFAGPIRAALADRAILTSIVVVISSISVSIKTFRNDRKRLLGY